MSTFETKYTAGMSDENKKCVDIYIPRKCNLTNRILHAKDKSSVQMSIAQVDENGRYTGKKDSFIFSGFIRSKGMSNNGLELLVKAQA